MDNEAVVLRGRTAPRCTPRCRGGGVHHYPQAGRPQRLHPSQARGLLGPPSAALLASLKPRSSSAACLFRGVDGALLDLGDFSCRDDCRWLFEPLEQPRPRLLCVGRGGAPLPAAVAAVYKDFVSPSRVTPIAPAQAGEGVTPLPCAVAGSGAGEGGCCWSLGGGTVVSLSGGKGGLLVHLLMQHLALQTLPVARHLHVKALAEHILDERNVQHEVLLIGLT